MEDIRYGLTKTLIAESLGCSAGDECYGKYAVCAWDAAGTPYTTEFFASKRDMNKWVATLRTQHPKANFFRY